MPSSGEQCEKFNMCKVTILQTVQYCAILQTHHSISFHGKFTIPNVMKGRLRKIAEIIIIIIII